MFYRQATDRLPTGYRQVTDRLPTHYQLSSDCRPTGSLYFGQNLSADSWPTVGRLSADSWPTVGQLSADRRPTVGRQLTDSRPTGFLGSSSSQLPTFELPSSCSTGCQDPSCCIIIYLCRDSGRLMCACHSPSIKIFLDLFPSPHHHNTMD